MNRLEADYHAHLELRRLAGEVSSFHFEALKIRLADRTWLTLDFVVLTSEGFLEFHEVKGGHWEKDSRSKTKIAAENFPEFRFLVARRVRGEWTWEELKSRQGGSEL